MFGIFFIVFFTYDQLKKTAYVTIDGVKIVKKLDEYPYTPWNQ